MATQQQQQQPPRRRGDNSSEGAAVTKLSMDYRAAMCECLMQLQSNEANGGDDDAPMKDHEENNNLELLSLTYAISHLAEIFLLPSLASEASSVSAYPSNFDGGFHDEAFASRLDGPSGSLTADTVRYLRLHHSNGSFMDSPEVLELLESDQPEYHQFSPSSSSLESSIPGPYDHPYWNLLLHLTIQGQLSDAWTLLSHHSACRHAEEEAEAGEELSPEGQGFAALRAILLSAPIPGGRGDGYCDDAGLDDYLEEDLLEQEEVENENAEDLGDVNAEDPGDINQLLMDGVPPNAYMLWESLPRRADKLRTLRYRRDLRRCGRTDSEGTEVESSTVPEMYQPRVALNAFRNWQETIRVTVFPSGVGSGGGQGVLAALFQRFPPLPQILSILLGVIPQSIANDARFLTWNEVLLMELLYARPEVMPEDIAVRAKVAMSKVGGGDGNGKHPLQEIILSIMNGSAGQVVETMFSLCGGSSGAALPATMTSLLCNLLVDTGCISPQKDASSSPVNIQTELLLLAAESILSSFSVQEQSDVGVRTTVRLLLPHAPPKKRAASRGAAADNTETKDDIIYEPRIAAMIAEAVSHRLPTTDAEARDLLQLCEETIQLGSVLIADACESLAFSRALHHSRSNNGSGNLTREVCWLLRGMEVQSCWLPEDRRRKLGFACRRRFDSLCEKSANNLITLFSVAAITNFSKNVKNIKEMSLALRAAEDVLEGVLQDEVMAPVLKGHVEANLLKYAVDIALADAKGDTVQVATDIIYCLEERCLSEGDYGGVVSTLADPKMYSDFLRIAFAVLDKEEVSQGGPMEFAKCAFTVHGMHILMARLTQVLSWEGIICSSHGPAVSASLSKQQPSAAASSKKDYFGAMRVAFSKGLMRAFVSNGPLSTPMKMGSKKECGEMSLEEELELMLSPCI